VTTAVSSLPREFRDKLENIDVVVEDWPSQYQLAEVGLRQGEALFGLYQGVPLTMRSKRYGLVPPDKITIFQKPIEARCVVLHEITHHFGIGDARLRQLERDGETDKLKGP